MSIDISKLNDMDRPSLVNLAMECGAKHHHKATDANIVKAIVDETMRKPVQELKHVAEKPTAPVYDNSPEDVEALIASIKERNPRLHTSYNTEENTWLFQWKYDNGRVGREECGNMAIPPRVIKRKAENVAKGPMVLRGHAAESFDRGNASGLSAYTNVVLA